MRLERCERGHFYDAERFSSCPHCDQTTVTGTVLINQEDDDINKTSGIQSEVMVSAIPTDSFAEPDDGQKTVGYFANMAIGSEPVVGWLVCIGGNHFGEDFKLKAGRNFIGRSSEMDVALTGDASVSRDRHAIILYEPRNNIFIVQSGDAKELFYLNDKVVLNATEISAYDKLTLGNSTLLFVPCCSDKFKWEDYKKEEEK